ncbi:peptide-methionine (S)-S-oxide reductase MsrA [Clostridium tyrobutyricum]|uniref:peptide-methionine (S)-S-oxide reductase MsrA n=1 Tax=Clostridium tyrobutyricum TaxID=1519 RepID=UPI001C387849|nr:peptide-methionine (S)-S-oxide reductase MsrA [Clostridium tyrobutyricum]MBV4417898.1 peptide-methionine (S)-S-oxide reductase MsrA [Clostridium tyrobutyricum]
MKKIVLAGGCFWGVQSYFDSMKGVSKTVVGYANGKTKNPTYEEVCNYNTGFAEACLIEYDENLTILKELLEAYWKIVDPTLKDRQGNDVGNQYRTGIYYLNEEDIEEIDKSKKDEQKKYKDPIVTEVEHLKNFYEAEEYHQNYLHKNPNGYCHIPRDLFKN